MNEEGHLFASINAEKLAEILKKEHGFDLDSKLIELENPIKQAGVFEIPVRVGDRLSKFKLSIESK